MRYLAIIPARKGSKGIQDKNIKLLNGKPLIQYTIEVAKEVFSAIDICVSTDSKVIKKIAEDLGLLVPFLRPKHLASDTAAMNEVLLHALNFYQEKEQRKYDVVVLLQPTSPFRTALQIKEALQLFDKELDMVVSVKETKSNPYFVLFEEDELGFLKKSKAGLFTRRQDCPKVWEYNGAIYIINSATLLKQPLNEFRKIKKYVMSSNNSIDIDTPLDWKLAELLLKEKGILS